MVYEKCVLQSIKPKYCQMIANKQKTLEIRSTAPKMKPPFRVYIYCTAPNTKDPWEYLELHDRETGHIYKMNGHVIGEYICDRIDEYDTSNDFVPFSLRVFSCVSGSDILKYGKKRGRVFAWHISELKIYERPLELGELKTFKKIERPPQGWQYIARIVTCENCNLWGKNPCYVGRTDYHFCEINQRATLADSTCENARSTTYK